MTLFDFWADLKETNAQLRRIGDALERLAPMPDVATEPEPTETRKTTADMIRKVDMTGEQKVLREFKKYGV